MLVELTAEKAKSLSLGEIIYDLNEKNADGTPRRWKVNGVVKTWKTRPNDFRVPLKHGLKTYDYISEESFDEDGKCKFNLAVEENF